MSYYKGFGCTVHGGREELRFNAVGIRPGPVSVSIPGPGGFFQELYIGTDLKQGLAVRTDVV